MANPTNGRRGFLRRLMAASGLAAAGAPAGQAQGSGNREYRFLPRYARAQDYKSLKQSSFDITAAIAMHGLSRRAASTKFSKPPDRA